MNNKEIIEKKFNAATRSKKIHEAVLLVENTQGDFSVNCGYGGKDIHSPMFTASVTKLFVTSCILILREQNKLSLDNKISDYLDKSIPEGLHVYKGKEYSQSLTISDLLFQTSGLPDGLIEGGFLNLLTKNDMDVSFETVLDKTKALHPHFAPNTPKKAYYSDMNFRLLCEIIEKVSGAPYAQAFQDFVFAPLGMYNTYLPAKSDDFTPKIYYKNDILYRPKYLTDSYNYDAVSTAVDLMRFLKAFFGGALFSKDIFEKLSVYRKLQMTMGPIYYGGGYMQIPLCSILTLYMGKGELIGHSGHTGSFAFYYPHRDLYFVGDVNQMANPGLPVQLVMKLAMSLK
jgi:CubicO group peptidase (beta-lactamase class C family)